MQDQQLLDLHHHKYPFKEFPPRRPTPSKEQQEQQELYLYWLDRLADPTKPLLYDYPDIRHRPTNVPPVPPRPPSTPSNIRVSNRLSRVPPRPSAPDTGVSLKRSVKSPVSLVPPPPPRPSAPDTEVSLKRSARSPVSPVPPLPKRTRQVMTTVKEEEPIDKSSWTCKYCGRELKTRPYHDTFTIKRHLLHSPTLHPDIPKDTIYKDYGSVLGMTRDQVRRLVKNRKR